MTTENLATVFAPTIFRDHIPEQKSSKKSRCGSQEDLLSEIKRVNELKVLVVQVLIENAEKIGVPKDCYKATRRPSDLKKKERGLMASSVQRNKRLKAQKESSPEVVPEDPIVKPSVFPSVKSRSESSPTISVNIPMTRSSGEFTKSRGSVFTRSGGLGEEALNERFSKVNIRRCKTTVRLHKEPLHNCSPTAKRPVKPVCSPMNIESLFNRPSDLRFLLEVVGRPSIAQIQGSGIVHRRIEQFTNLGNDSD